MDKKNQKKHCIGLQKVLSIYQRKMGQDKTDQLRNQVEQNHCLVELVKQNHRQSFSPHLV